MFKSTLTTILLFFLFGIISFSQSNKHFWETKNSYGFLSVGGSYSNKANLFGTFNPLVQQSSIISYASFYSKNQTDLMITHIYTTNADTSLESSTSIFSFSVGKEFSLNKNFSLNFIFDKYFYPEIQNNLNPNYKDVLSASLSYNPKFLWTGIQFDVLNAQRTDFSLNATLSPILTIEKLFYRSLSATLMPYISFDFATQKYIQTAYDQLMADPVTGIQYFLDAETIREEITEQVNTRIDELERHGQRTFESNLRNILADFYLERFSVNYLNNLYEDEKENLAFNLNSINVSIPFTLYISNIGLGFSYSWYIPTYESTLFNAETTQYFSIDLTYIKTIRY